MYDAAGTCYIYYQTTSTTQEIFVILLALQDTDSDDIILPQQVQINIISSTSDRGAGAGTESDIRYLQNFIQ